MKEREKITMLTTIIIVVAIYFVAMLGIGWYGRRYSSTFDGYLSMGRSGGILLLMGSAIGANIGNGFVVGGAGGGATSGLAGSAYGLACAVSTLVAVFLCDFIYKHNYNSLADYTRERYHSEVPGVIYDISTAISSIGLLAGQLMAGKALFETLGMPGVAGVISIAVVVFIYSQLAGLWGAYATSVVQTAVIALGLFLTIGVLFSNDAIGTIKAAQAAGTATPGALDFSGMTPAGFLAMGLPIVLVVSTVLTRDILIGTMKKEYSEKQLSKITLGLNIALLVVGVTLALNAGSILDVLNAFYAFLAAACFIPFFGGLLWKKGSAKGAIAASVAGIIVVVLGWLGVSLPSLGGFFPCIPSAIAFVIVSLIAPDKAKT